MKQCFPNEHEATQLEAEAVTRT